MSRRPSTSWGGYVHRKAVIDLDKIQRMAENNELVRIMSPSVVSGDGKLLVAYIGKFKPHRRYYGYIQNTAANRTQLNVIVDAWVLAQRAAKAARVAQAQTSSAALPAKTL